jgi:hypothetical protein
MQITDNILDIALKAQRNIIEDMENVEDWVISNPELNDKINEFSKRFKELNSKKSIDKENIIRIVAYLHTGNMLNVINNIKDEDSKYVKELISIINLINKEDESNKMTHLFAERLMVIYRLHVLPRIFSPERIKALNNVLKDIEN